MGEYLETKGNASEAEPRLILGGGTCSGIAVIVSVFVMRKDQSLTDIST